MPELCPQCLMGLALRDSNAVHRPDGNRDHDAMTQEHSFAPGRIVAERYQVREVLGRGGMGDVFRAYDLKLRLDVALKAIRAGRFDSERGREILRREVRSARAVVSPNVCRIFDLVIADAEELVSMEYIDGITLTERLRAKGPLSLQDAREIAAQFLSGLEAIHGAGLVHRDFKPENVMITRAGRVVVMDFGLAQVPTEGLPGTISGTPAYMAPEQAVGDRVDSRADVFAAGMVLAEMLAVGGEANQESRIALWRAARDIPPRVPDGPWSSVLRKALAANPHDRYASALALAHALEEVTLRSPGFEEKRPYPGLASFTEENAKYFFGREVEVEAVWKKLKRPRLLALIGPSGAGKSSFLRAGLLPALPKTWKAIIATPGSRPFQFLAQALAPAFAGDAEAVQALLRFEEEDAAVLLLQRLRARHEQALVVVDQFEELYTLSPPDVQAAFARLLGRLVLESDLFVILSLRDDFLIRCNAHESLAPAFTDLTPLGPLGEAALRRALVQPALACGYRFEDEALVEEMISEVKKERGALPPLAFAAARLWEKRDRDAGVLTRQAYQEIGGVAGALAQHAEDALGTIGTQRIPLVRELFRNLVTSQGTRTVRGRAELLSVFDAENASNGTRGQAEEVLNALVDARLLTSYERAGDEGESQQELEIIHESLLTAWPRLIRWQTQDADGAQVRDQLRQAAQVWEERGRPEDLLWSGTAYRDFAVWREHYPGGLSTTEDAFAKAAERRAGRKKRKRQLAAAAAIATVATVAVTTTILWRHSETMRQRAEAETLRAEASKLLVMGERELDRYPTAALAYTLKSLELADTDAGRLLALRVIQRAPVARLVRASDGSELGGVTEIAFSPNSEWAAWAGPRKAEVLHRDGDQRLLLGDFPAPGPLPIKLRFGSANDSLVANRLGDIRVWAIPDGRELQRAQIDTGSSTLHSLNPLQAGRAGFMTITTVGPKHILRLWPLPSGEPLLIGSLDADVIGRMSASGTTLTYAAGRSVYVRSIVDWSTPPRLIADHNVDVTDLALSPDAARVVIGDMTRELRIWPTAARSNQPDRVLQFPANVVGTGYDGSGRRLYGLTFERGYPAVGVIDLMAPRGADPLVLQKGDTSNAGAMAFAPSGSWLATTHGLDVAFWPLATPRPQILRQQTPMFCVDFTPDGTQMLALGLDRTMRAWPLNGGGEARVLHPGSARLPALPWMVLDRSGRKVALAGGRGQLSVVRLDDGSVQRLQGLPDRGMTGKPAFSEDGRLLAAGMLIGPQQDKAIRVWDLESGALRTFGPLPGAGNGRAGGTPDLHFIGRDRLLAAITGTGIVSLDLRSGATEVVVAHPTGRFVLSREGRFAVGITGQEAPRGSRPVSRIRLDDRSVQTLSRHGTDVTAIAMDPTDSIVATGSADGTIRIGSVSGEEPHVLLGQQGTVHSMAFSPNGRWLATAGEAFAIHLWPVPDVLKPPPHRRPYDDLLNVLRSHTNLRAVPDASSATGYTLALGPFPGWAKVPEW